MEKDSDMRRAKAMSRPPPLPTSGRQTPPPLPRNIPTPAQGDRNKAALAARKKKAADAKLREEVLKPGELDSLKDLLLFAQVVVEGWFSGKHRSVDYGSSAEFAEFKPYVQGDPVSQIDWKAYARSRELLVRKTREEKDMTGYLVVDSSRSMAYTADGRDSKQMRAAKIAAALSYLMHHQGDKSSLALFHEKLKGYLPPGSTKRHLHDTVSLLAKAAGMPKGKTAAAEALDVCVPLFKKRGSIVVISDFFTDLDKFFDAIAQFQHRRFNILLLHVIDPDEHTLPDVAMARFVDMESGKSLQVAPDEIRIAYRKEMKQMTDRLETESARRGIEYRQLRTEEPYREALEAWMGLRSGSKKGATR